MLNPFEYKKPATTMFAGRDKELKKIDEYFQATIKYHQSNHFLITGERGIGKTSIIQKIMSDYENDVFFVLVSLGQSDSTSELVKNIVKSFYNEIEEKNSDSVFEKVKSHFSKIKSIEVGGIALKIKDGFDAEVADNFHSILLGLWNQIQAQYQCMAIIIDETDRLGYGGSGNEFLEKFSFKIRSTIENIDRKTNKIKFIISSIPSVLDKMKDIHQSVARTLYHVSVNNFDRDSTIKVLEAGLTMYGEKKEVTEGFKNLLFKYSEGVPYYIQAICHFAFRSSEGSKLDESVFREAVLGNSDDDGVIDELEDYPLMNTNSVRDSEINSKILVYMAEKAEKGEDVSLDELVNKFTKDIGKENIRQAVSTLMSNLKAKNFTKKGLQGHGSYALSGRLVKLWIDKNLRNIPLEKIELSCS